MSDPTPDVEFVPAAQAWRFNPDGFYADQYAQSTARLGIGIDYQDDDFDRYKAQFLADLEAHDASVKAEAIRDMGGSVRAGSKGEPMTEQGSVREELARTIGGALSNVTHFPEAVRARLLGQNMKPLEDIIVASLLSSAAIPRIQAEAWDEGHEDGVWNAEHEAMIERGNRERITNPYRKG